MENAMALEKERFIWDQLTHSCETNNYPNFNKSMNDVSRPNIDNMISNAKDTFCE